MPIDPRINCAQEICCNAPQAVLATAEIINETCGVDMEYAKVFAHNLIKAGYRLAAEEQIAPWREVCDHPRKKEKEPGNSAE